MDLIASINTGLELQAYAMPPYEDDQGDEQAAQVKLDFYPPESGAVMPASSWTLFLTVDEADALARRLAAAVASVHDGTYSEAGKRIVGLKEIRDPQRQKWADEADGRA